MKLAIIFNDHKLSGWLTKFWTGCYAYHCAWVDEASGTMYDMNLLRRKREWPHYPEGWVVLFDAPPGITVEYLEYKLKTCNARYGVADYLLFSLRPFYHLLGKSTRNASGKICSEILNDDVWETGGTTPWTSDVAPPSPCGLYEWKQKK